MFFNIEKRDTNTLDISGDFVILNSPNPKNIKNLTEDPEKGERFYCILELDRIKLFENQ